MAKNKSKRKGGGPRVDPLPLPPEVQEMIEMIKNLPQGPEHAHRRLVSAGIIDEDGNLTDTYTKPWGVSRADSRVYLRD